MTGDPRECHVDVFAVICRNPRRAFSMPYSADRWLRRHKFSGTTIPPACAVPTRLTDAFYVHAGGWTSWWTSSCAPRRHGQFALTRRPTLAEANRSRYETHDAVHFLHVR